MAPGPARAAKYQKIRIDQAPASGFRAGEPESGRGAGAARKLVTVTPAGPPRPPSPQADSESESEAELSDLESHALEDQEVTVSPGQGQDRVSVVDLEELEPGKK